VVLGLVTHRMFTNLKSFDHRAQYRTFSPAFDLT